MTDALADERQVFQARIARRINTIPPPSPTARPIMVAVAMSAFSSLDPLDLKLLVLVEGSSVGMGDGERVGDRVGVFVGVSETDGA